MTCFGQGDISKHDASGACSFTAWSLRRFPLGTSPPGCKGALVGLLSDVGPLERDLEDEPPSRTF